MARKNKVWKRTVYKQDLMWWIMVGWWWRPITFLLTYFFAKILGYTRIETTIVTIHYKHK